ncbi:MAG: PTS sugar transporter subunit IIA [Candidatus Muiribacterium halophilum]|uniref:PTS sugar transporter subunit IIA n=1 Tax=Muiribacterium halophilum TaxID=2053465 RepID=A0A2N5ZAN7_MUIH1|nr:MAG: PTS sugar transporter subunit IIA [Candidatus Muirbacterium halophilum]
MELSNVLREDAIIMDIKSKDKDSIIEELIDSLKEKNIISCGDSFKKSVIAREKLGSTGIGKGIAIPHGKVQGLDEVVLSLGLSKTGVDFDALDDKKVHCIFLIGASPEKSSGYLQVLAKLSRMVRYPEFRDKLINSKNPKDVIDIILNYEQNE